MSEDFTDNTPPAPQEKTPLPPLSAFLSAEEKPAAKPEPAKGSAYEFKTPEGVELPPEILSGFEQEASSLKLKPEQAQKILDLGIKAVAEHRTQTQAGWEKILEAETRSIQTDPVLGGKNYARTQAVAMRAYNAVRAELPLETQKNLDSLMIGGKLANLRPVAEFLHAIGRRFFAEDSPLLDDAGHGGRPQAEGFNYDAVKSVFGKNRG